MVRDRSDTYLAPVGLGALWLATQAWLLLYGARGNLISQSSIVRHGNDSLRYLEAAGLLMQGKLMLGKVRGFLGYDLFVTFFLWSGLGEVGMVLAQSLLTLAAAYCLYRIGLRLYDRRVGLLAAFAYVLYPELHLWDFYILSESLFVSMVIISLFLVLEARGWWRTALACLVVGYTSTIRPNGFILMLSAGVFFTYLMWRRRRFYVLAGAACALVLVLPLAVEVLSGFWARYAPVSHLAKGVVVASYKESHLVMPGLLPPGLGETQGLLYRYLLFIAYKPLFFLQLVFWRLWYMFLAVRPYYSATHNYILLMTLVPTYLLAAWGGLHRVNTEGGRLLLVSLICFQSLVVALTFVDSDNRGLLLVLPISFVLAAVGVRGLWEQAKDLLASPVSRQKPPGRNSRLRLGSVRVRKESSRP